MPTRNPRGEGGRRRVRVRRRTTLVSGVDQDRLVHLLHQYRLNEAHAELLKAEMAGALVEVETIMNAHGLKDYHTPDADAEIATPKGKGRTVIDPAEFQEMVTPEEFMECVSIGVTPAKKVLSERELAQCSEFVKPKPKDPVLTIRAKTMA